jgi:hypothetical protein
LRGAFIIAAMLLSLLLALLLAVARAQLTIEAVSSFLSCIVDAPPQSQGTEPFTGPPACLQSGNFSSIIVSGAPTTGAGDTFEVNLASAAVTASDRDALGDARTQFESANLSVRISPVLIKYPMERDRPVPNSYAFRSRAHTFAYNAYDSANRDLRANAIYVQSFQPSNATVTTRSWRAVCERPPQFGTACIAGGMSGICQGAYRLEPYVVLPDFGGGTSMPQCLHPATRPGPFEPPFELAQTPRIVPCINVNADRNTNDPNGVIIDALGGGDNCNRLFCAICLQKLGPGTAIGSFRSAQMGWRFPIWRTFTLRPEANLVYNVTLRIERAGTDPVEIAVGSITETNGQSRVELSQASPDGRVRLDLLGQARFGNIPAQDGIIFALEDRWRPGDVELLPGESLANNWNAPPGCLQNAIQARTPGNPACNASRDDLPPACAPLINANGTRPSVYRHIARSGTFGVGYEEGPLNPRGDFGAPPPTSWGWCRQGEGYCNFGPNCNQVGISNDFYQAGENADIVCFSGNIDTCIPGHDTWSPSSGAMLPPEFIAANQQSYAENPQLRQPYMPDFLQFDDGVQRTWLHDQALYWQPPQSVGVKVRFRILIDGAFVRFLRVLPTGFLRYINESTPTNSSVNPTCNVVVGQVGALRVEACNNDTLAGSYFTRLDCSASESLVVQGPIDESFGLDAGQCLSIEYAIQATGAFIETTKSCNVLLFDSEANPLFQLGATCTQGIPFTQTLDPAQEAQFNELVESTQPFPEWAQILLAVLAVAFAIGLMWWMAVAFRSWRITALKRELAQTEAEKMRLTRHMQGVRLVRNENNAALQYEQSLRRALPNSAAAAV